MTVLGMEVAAAYPALALIASSGRAVEADDPPTHYDGPRVARWLVEHRAWPTDDSRARTARRWRAGAAASVEAIDRLLIDTHLSIGDVPLAFAVDDPNRNPEKCARGALPQASYDERLAAVEAYQASGPKGRRQLSAIAAAHDVNPATLKRWSRRHEQGRL